MIIQPIDPNLNIVRDGLVFWFDARFQTSYPASGTTLYDLSGNDYDGTLVNGVGYSSADGGTLTFDGVNDYANCGTISELSGIYDVSASIWVKVISNTGGNAIINRYYNTNANNGWVIYAVAASEPFTFVWGGREQSGPFLSCETSSNYYLSQWYHITGVKAANLWKIYVNGNLENSQTLGSGNIAFLDNVTYLASYPQFPEPPNRNHNIYIAQTQIYSRALSAAEVSHNYNTTKGRFL